MKKSERRKHKKMNAERKAKGLPTLTRVRPRQPLNLPSAAPPAREEMPSTAFRRKSEKHPLEKVREKLSEEQFEAGSKMRVLCETLQRSGIDCTAGLGTTSARGNGQIFWTVEQASCIESLTRIKGAIADWEYQILRDVLGKAWPISEAVKAHAICHEDGTLKMFQNCLLQLALAIKFKGDVPRFVHREVVDRIKALDAYGA